MRMEGSACMGRESSTRVQWPIAAPGRATWWPSKDIAATSRRNKEEVLRREDTANFRLGPPPHYDQQVMCLYLRA